MQQPVISRVRGRRRLVAAGVAALLLAAVAPTAADAEGWIPGPAFEIGYPAAGAAAAATPSGAAYAAWIQDDELVLQHAAADGARGPIRKQRDAVGPGPFVAAGDGGAAVVWVHDPAGPFFELRLLLLRPDGEVRAEAELDPNYDSIAGEPAVAIAPDGDALVVWTRIDGMDTVVRAQRVAADGTPGPLLELGRASGGLDAALAPDGTGWITWADDVQTQQVARVGADGSVDGAAAALPVDTGITSPALDASAAGAIFTGVELTRVEGVRLPLDGALIDTGFESSTGVVDHFGASAVLADDGTVALAWTEDDGAPAVTARYSRIAPGAASGSAEPIAPQSGGRTAFPRLALAADGSLLAAWVAGGSQAGGPLVARRIAADGSRGIALRTGLRVSRPDGTFVPAERIVPLASTPDGGGFAATIDVEAADSSAIETAVLDVTPPQVAATFPSVSFPGVRLPFEATATDRAGVSYWWDFGDGSGARTAHASHAYALNGRYDATLTVTDGAGNVTSIARPVAIVIPTAPPPPPLPGPPAPLPPVTRAGAALRLTSAVRRGSAVTVTGTIATSATGGTVALVYAQKQGRRTLTARASARIADGRFRATIRLARALAKRFRLKPTVTASYAGNTATEPGEVARTVTVRAARRAARARRGRRGARR